MEKDLQTAEVVELGDAKELTQGLDVTELHEENLDFIYRE